jgi:hypothetical protein
MHKSLKLAALAAFAVLCPAQTDWLTQVRNKPLIDAREYRFTRTNGKGAAGDLSVAGAQSVALNPCPAGLAGANPGHYIYISGGVGVAEAALLTGGTCLSGAASGTIEFTTANAHTGVWAITSATAGIQEALNVAGMGGSVFVPKGDHRIYGPITMPRGTVSGVYRRTSLIGAGHESTRILVDASFPLAAAGVIDARQTVLYQWSGDFKWFSIYFTQPDSANIADYTHWPVAINIDGGSEAHIEDVRIFDAWNGITARGTWNGATWIPDTSRWTLKNVGVTAYNVAVEQGGSWDTIRIDGYHCQAGFAGIDQSPAAIVNKATVFYQNTTCLKLGHADDVKISNSLMGGKYALHATTGNGSGPYVECVNCSFDSGGAVYWDSGRELRITNSNFYSGAHQTQAQVKAVQGTVLISNSKFNNSNPSHPSVQYDQASLGSFFGTSLLLSNNRFVQAAGEAGSAPVIDINVTEGKYLDFAITGNTFAVSPAAVYANAVIRVRKHATGFANGAITGNVAAIDTGSTRAFIDFDNDSRYYMANNLFPGMTATLPASIIAGIYQDGTYTVAPKFLSAAFEVDGGDPSRTLSLTNAANGKNRKIRVDANGDIDLINNAYSDTSQVWHDDGSVTLRGIAFENLGAPANGTIAYCSDCAVGDPCVGGGTGALAKRLNGAWVCN